MTRTATARQPKVAKVAKVQYKPHVTKESATTYTVQSKQYVHVLRTITVAGERAVSCDCEGNAAWGKTCHHMKAVQFVLDYNAHQQHIRPAVSWDDLAAEFAALPVPAFDFSALAPVLPAPIELAARRKPMMEVYPAPVVTAMRWIPAPDSLMECFS